MVYIGPIEKTKLILVHNELIKYLQNPKILEIYKVSKSDIDLLTKAIDASVKDVIYESENKIDPNKHVRNIEKVLDSKEKQNIYYKTLEYLLANDQGFKELWEISKNATHSFMQKKVDELSKDAENAKEKRKKLEYLLNGD